MSTTASITSVPSHALFVPSSLGELHVKYNGHDFFVIDTKANSRQLQRCDLSEELRGISSEQLNKYLGVAYLSLNQAGETYTLRLNGRLRGGGLIGTLVMGALSYLGGPAVAVGAAVGVTAGVALGNATAPAGASEEEQVQHARNSGMGTGAGAVAGAVVGGAAATTACTSLAFFLAAVPLFTPVALPAYVLCPVVGGVLGGVIGNKIGEEWPTTPSKTK